VDILLVYFVSWYLAVEDEGSKSLKRKDREGNSAKKAKKIGV